VDGRGRDDRGKQEEKEREGANYMARVGVDV
jgi:hypothetical protein